MQYKQKSMTIPQKVALVAGLLDAVSKIPGGGGNSGVGGNPSVHPTEDDDGSTTAAGRADKERDTDPRVTSKDARQKANSIPRPPIKHPFGVVGAGGDGLGALGGLIGAALGAANGGVLGALGGALAGLASTLRVQLLLIPLGGLFVIITMSVIIQTLYFKATGGKRIFRMAPLHHHFELKGWGEVTIVLRFWIIAGLCVALGLGLFYAQWLSLKS
jgi:hypothetical protein